MADKPARYEVLLTQGAKQDLEAILDYIAEFDSVANANYVLDRLMKAVEGLAQFPERASYPRELAALGIREYLQTVFKGIAEKRRERSPGRVLPECSKRSVLKYMSIASAASARDGERRRFSAFPLVHTARLWPPPQP